MLTVDRVLDRVLDEIAQLRDGIFWNAAPRIVLDEDDHYLPPFTNVRTPLDRTDDESFRRRAREATFVLLSKIALDVNHPHPLAIGPNENVLVFRRPALSCRYDTDGRISENGLTVSRLLQVCVAWFDGDLVMEYKTDLLGEETQRIERCRQIR